MTRGNLNAVSPYVLYIIAVCTSPVSKSLERLQLNAEACGLAVSNTRIPMDGNCFFHAAHDQCARLNLQALSAADMRKEVATYLQSLPPEDPLSAHVTEEYINSLKRDGTWADAVCIQATARFLNRDIIVIRGDDNGSACQSLFPHETTPSRNRQTNNDCMLLGHYDNHFVCLQIINNEVNNEEAKEDNYEHSRVECE